MEYTLKDKLTITKEFLKELEIKSWQEIEHLQDQIANIEATEEAAQLIQLLKNLLTSYYVFTGGLENLSAMETFNFNKASVSNNAKEPTVEKTKELTDDDCSADLVLPNSQITAHTTDISTDEPVKKMVTDDIEPFEYFVDFDEPVGDPWTDDDLYKN